MSKLFPFFLGVLIIYTACVPAEDTPVFTSAALDFSDPKIIALKTFQDNQQFDSLSVYASHENPAYRHVVAQAFASFQTERAVPILEKLLDDEFKSIRSAAAYALGQIAKETSEPVLIKAFNQYDSTSHDLTSNNRILEAVGKTGALPSLDALSTVSTYRYTDTALLVGQTRGIYRFGLRNIVSQNGTDRMLAYVFDDLYPSSVRVMAANYLQRVSGIKFDSVVEDLGEVLKNDSNPYIRMAIATAIGKQVNAASLSILKDALKNEKDDRVVANLVRGINRYSYRQARDEMFRLINHKNPEIAAMGAQFLINKSGQDDALRVRTLSQQNKPWQVKSKLYGASNRHLPSYYAITKTNIKNEIKALISKSSSPYAKAAYLDALGQDIRNYAEVKKIGFEASHPAMNSGAVFILGNILSDDSFRRVFGGQRRSVATTIKEYLIEAATNGDAGMMAAAAGILRSDNENLPKLTDNELGSLRTAMEALELPRQIETYNELLHTITKAGGEPFVPKETAINHPIDWSLISPMRDKINGEMITDRGLIKFELYPKEAPGSVSNFVYLTRQGFYNEKVFHRVVPNFVIQGGCPRGDGYGSLDYSIRSELAPMYYDGEGYIGMASAGLHTEGTQFFITHSPTPHLDGKYTIFGKVTEGMGAVHQIEVGDKIQEVNILD